MLLVPGADALAAVCGLDWQAAVLGVGWIVGLMWTVSSKEGTRNLVTPIREARTSKATKTEVLPAPEGHQKAQPQ